MKIKGYLTAAIFALTGAAFAAPLVAYALTGSHMRLSGDDYCYESVLARLGFFAGQKYSYLQEATYNGNRYSLTLFSHLAGLFGPLANGVLPGLAIALWLAGMLLALRALAKAFGFRLGLPEAGTASLGLVFFAFYLAPDLVQILYWRSGMLPYLAPLIANTFLLAILLGEFSRTRFNPLTGGLVLLLAFLAGGFSEAGAAFQTSFLLLLLMGGLAAARFGRAGAPRSTLLTSIALAGTLLALAALFLSPTNRIRMENSPPPPDLAALLSMSADHSAIFIHSSLKSFPTPFIVILAFSACLAFYFTSRPSGSSGGRSWRPLAGLLLIPPAVYTLVLFSMTPSAYVQFSYPEARALVIPRTAMALGFAAAGGLVGFASGRLAMRAPRLSPYLAMGAILLIAGMSIYPVRASLKTFSGLARYQKWSSFWDARHLQMLDSRQAGIKAVEVIEIDHIIPRVGDLSPDPDAWYNNCAEMYYGFDSISANQPGWDQ